MDDIDIHRNAKLLIDQCSSDAIKHAKRRLDAMVVLGDRDGARAWKRIMQVITQIQGEGNGTRY